MLNKIALGLVGLSMLAILMFFMGVRLVKTLPEEPRRFANDLYLSGLAQINDLFAYFYPKTYFHQKFTEKLPVYNLVIDPASLKNIQEDVFQAIDNNFLSNKSTHKEKIDLIFNGQTYPAKINLSGTTKGNFKFNKKSFAVDLDKLSINGRSSFKLLNPSQHQYLAGFLANNLAQRLNLYYNHQFPVKVTLNGADLGVYIFEENLNDEFLARIGINEGEIIKLKDTWAENHYTNTFGLNAHHLSAFDFEISNVEKLFKNSDKTLFMLDSLFEGIKQNNLEEIAKYVDIDYMARYDAYREFLGVDHDVAGDNLKLIFLPEANKFYPIVRSEGDINPLAIEKGTTLLSFNHYDSHIASAYDYPRIFLLLHHNDQFRKLKYQYLNQLVNQFLEINKENQSIFNQYADMFIYDVRDDDSIRFKKKLIRGFLETIQSNKNLIQKQFSFGSVFINIVNNQNSTIIEILPDSVAPIEFLKFQLKLDNDFIGREVNISVNDSKNRLVKAENLILNDNQDIKALINSNIIFPKFNEDMSLMPTTYIYTITPAINLQAVDVLPINATTGLSIEDIHTASASE